MRTFIAIELPPEVKTRLTQLQKELRETGADVKWVEPRNIHLTLKFLGEINKEVFIKLIGILENLAKKTGAFKATLSSLGVFPKNDFARVIWVGMDKGTTIISSNLEEKIQELGIPKEKRPFSTHITLGRIRSTKNKEKLMQELIKAGGKLAQENLEFNVDKIVLFKSTLSSSGPIYETLKAVTLSAS